MAHLLVMCGEFERDQCILVNEVSRIEGLESGWRNRVQGR